jgi:hypothetical protein
VIVIIYFIQSWKGENVATTEIALVLSKVEGVLDVNVYGVIVPGFFI